MELAALERELESRTPEEQDRLALYLAVLRAKRNPDYKQVLSHRLDQADGWIGLDGLKTKINALRMDE